jgi:isopentenyl-diphosphate delta-isomerase
MEEEIGLTAELEQLHKFPGTPENAYEHTVLYRAFSDAVPRPDPNEVESLHYFELDELTEQIRQSPDRFTPPFRQLLAWYVENCS